MFDHQPAHGIRAGAAAVLVDVEPVGRGAAGHDLGPEFPQSRRRDLVGCAVRAVDHHLQAVESLSSRKGALHELDIAALRVVEATGAAERRGRRQLSGHVRVDQGLYLFLRPIGQLVAVRPEQLDAVVLIRIVGSGNHDAEIGSQAAGQHGHRRRRHRPGQNDVHPRGDEAGRERGLQQVAGEPGVLPDHHGMTMRPAGEDMASRHARPQRRRGRHGFCVRKAAKAVGAKKPSRHFALVLHATESGDYSRSASAVIRPSLAISRSLGGSRRHRAPDAAARRAKARSRSPLSYLEPGRADSPRRRGVR